MSEKEENSITISEVLVALDSSIHSRAALETAAMVAELMQADLSGIFVREKEWKKISRLSSAQEIDEKTGEISAIVENRVDEQIRNLEKEIREHFELIAERNKIQSSWKSVEGAVNEEVLEEAKNADLITIGSRGRSYTKRNRLGSTAKAIITESQKPILILQEGFKIGRVAVALYDGSPKSRKSVKLAATLAEKNESALIILDLEGDHRDSDQRISDLRKLTEHANIEADQMVMKNPDIGRFTYLLRKIGSGLLVMPNSPKYIKSRNLEHILESVSCPVLLMS